MVELIRKFSTYAFGLGIHLEGLGIGKERLGELYSGRLNELRNLVGDGVVQEVSKRIDREDELKKKAVGRKKKAVGDSPSIKY
jgi:hypothetical protein